MWIVVDGSASTNRQAGRDGLVAAKQLAKEIIVRFTSGIRGTTCPRVNLKPNSARKDPVAKKKQKRVIFCQKLWLSMDFWDRVMLLIVVWPKWFKSIPSWPIRINPLHSSYNRPCWLHDVELGHPSARNTSYNLGESHCCIVQYPGGTIS